MRRLLGSPKGAAAGDEDRSLASSATHASTSSASTLLSKLSLKRKGSKLFARKRKGAGPTGTGGAAIPTVVGADRSLDTLVEENEGAEQKQLEDEASKLRAEVARLVDASRDVLVRVALTKPLGLVFEPVPAAGGGKERQRGARIGEILPSSSAGRSQKLKVGDELVAVDDEPMTDRTFEEVMECFVRKEGKENQDRLALLFRRSGTEENEATNSTKRKNVPMRLPRIRFDDKFTKDRFDMIEERSDEDEESSVERRDDESTCVSSLASDPYQMTMPSRSHSLQTRDSFQRTIPSRSYSLRSRGSERDAYLSSFESNVSKQTYPFDGSAERSRLMSIPPLFDDSSSYSVSTNRTGKSDVSKMKGLGLWTVMDTMEEEEGEEREPQQKQRLPAQPTIADSVTGALAGAVTWMSGAATGFAAAEANDKALASQAGGWTVNSAVASITGNASAVPNAAIFPWMHGIYETEGGGNASKASRSNAGSTAANSATMSKSSRSNVTSTIANSTYADTTYTKTAASNTIFAESTLADWSKDAASKSWPTRTFLNATWGMFRCGEDADRTNDASMGTDRRSSLTSQSFAKAHVGGRHSMEQPSIPTSVPTRRGSWREQEQEWNQQEPLRGQQQQQLLQHHQQYQYQQQQRQWRDQLEPSLIPALPPCDDAKDPDRYSVIENGNEDRQRQGIEQQQSQQQHHQQLPGQQDLALAPVMPGRNDWSKPDQFDSIASHDIHWGHERQQQQDKQVQQMDRQLQNQHQQQLQQQNQQQKEQQRNQQGQHLHRQQQLQWQDQQQHLDQRHHDQQQHKHQQQWHNMPNPTPAPQNRPQPSHQQQLLSSPTPILMPSRYNPQPNLDGPTGEKQDRHEAHIAYSSSESSGDTPPPPPLPP